MKTLIWYDHFVCIERGTHTHTYALRRISFESMRRLWSVRDTYLVRSQDFYKTIYTK
jgi:hypothetical protein